jgi:hypothetical protein
MSLSITLLIRYLRDKYLTYMFQSVLPSMQRGEQQIDSLDKELLNEIQWVFPFVQQPFLEI